MRFPAGDRQATGHMHNEDTLAIAMQFFHRHPVAQAFVKTRLSPPRLGEGRGAKDRARALVADAQDDFAATLVGDGHAILDQLVEMIPAGRRFELDPRPFRGGEQRGELVRRGGHGRSEAEAVPFGISVMSFIIHPSYFNRFKLAADGSSRAPIRRKYSWDSSNEPNAIRLFRSISLWAKEMNGSGFPRLVSASSTVR